MSVALVAQNKNKISFFLCANFLLFCRHQLKIFSGSINPDSQTCSGAYSAPLLYARVLHVLLSVALNN